MVDYGGKEDTMNRASIKISLEVKEKLDKLRHPGQTYDGIIKELIEKIKEKENLE